MGWIGFVFAILAGAANPFQSATNAELNKQMGRPIWAGLTVYITGLLGLLLIQIFARQAFPSGKLGSVHWWAWTGGFISIAATMAGLMLAQKMGSALFTGHSVAEVVFATVDATR